MVGRPGAEGNEFSPFGVDLDVRPGAPCPPAQRILSSRFYGDSSSLSAFCALSPLHIPALRAYQAPQWYFGETIPRPQDAWLNGMQPGRWAPRERTYPSDLPGFAQWRGRLGVRVDFTSVAKTSVNLAPFSNSPRDWSGVCQTASVAGTRLPELSPKDNRGINVPKLGLGVVEDAYCIGRRLQIRFITLGLDSAAAALPLARLVSSSL
ncbi:hypothetical protein AB1N83_013537 [Pleurotus pulmonarius]